MMENLPDVSHLSDEALQEVIDIFHKQSESHRAAVGELIRRRQLKESENKEIAVTSLRWSKIAGIASIVAAIFAVAQFYHSDQPVKLKTQQQVQGTQQTTKSPVSLPSSSSSSTLSAPSKKKR